MKAWRWTHSPTVERRDRKHLQAGPKQHANDAQMKRTEEEEATATNLIGKMEQNCVCIASEASASQETSVQARGKECKKGGKPNHFATVCRPEPDRQDGCSGSYKQIRPGSRPEGQVQRCAVTFSDDAETRSSTRLEHNCP